MRDKEKQRHYAYEALHILLLLALLLFITRMWPILLLLVILGIFVAALRLLFLSSKKVEPAEPVLALPAPEEPALETEKDMHAIVYQLIQRRISQILEEKYPGVRWIWENPYAKEDIIAGNKLYVILNRAGGYRRGLVVIRNFHVFDVIFEPVLEKNSPEAVPTNESHESHNQQPAADPAENDEDEEIPEDFGLIAFQWVEATIMELNEQVNEAIGRKENSFLIPSEDLPVKESWPDICKELARNDLSGAICHENGIQIEFEQ